MKPEISQPGIAEIGTSATEFTQRFCSTPRCARLARHLALHQLDRWGFHGHSSVSGTVAAVIAELVANAVTHGRVPGRGFRLRLELAPDTARPTVIRIEVTDTHSDKRPPTDTAPTAPAPDSETGRGLLLVATLATRWGVADRTGHPGKTVWAEIAVPPGGWPA